MKKRILSGLISLAVAAAITPAVFAETAAEAGFEYKWTMFDGTETGYEKTNSNLTTLITTGPSGESGDTAIKWTPWVGSGMGNGKVDHNNGHGLIFTVDEPISDASFVYSVDFMSQNDEVIAILAAPKPGNRWEFPLVVTLGVDGVVSFEGKQIAKIDINEWHNLAVLYTISSETGMTADVYFDGEYAASGQNKAFTGSIQVFDIRVNSATSDLMYNAVGPRYDSRCEYLAIDNLYITSDLTTVDYSFAVNDVGNNSMDELTVHFNQDIGDKLSAGNILISAADGSIAALVDSVSLVDARTAVLKLDSQLKARKSYAIVDMEETFDSYSFITGLALFYDFNDADDTIPFTPNNSALIYAGKGVGSYQTDENDKDFSFVTQAYRNSDTTGTMTRYANGYTFVTTEETITSGVVNLSYDFKYDSSTMTGWLSTLANGPSIPNLIYFEDNALISGVQKLADLEPGRWYNLTVINRFITAGVFTDVYLDGEELITDIFVAYGRGINEIKTLINAKTPEEYANGQYYPGGAERNEIFHIDNLYISSDPDYHTSAFKTSFDGDEAVIGAGAFDREGVAYLALYDGTDNTLKAVSRSDINMDALTTERIKAEFDEYQDGDVIKLICLASDTTLKPLTKVVSQ